MGIDAMIFHARDFSSMGIAALAGLAEGRRMYSRPGCGRAGHAAGTGIRPCSVKTDSANMWMKEEPGKSFSTTCCCLYRNQDACPQAGLQYIPQMIPAMAMAAVLVSYGSPDWMPRISTMIFQNAFMDARSIVPP